MVMVEMELSVSDTSLQADYQVFFAKLSCVPLSRCSPPVCGCMSVRGWVWARARDYRCSAWRIRVWNTFSVANDLSDKAQEGNCWRIKDKGSTNMMRLRGGSCIVERSRSRVIKFQQPQPSKLYKWNHHEGKYDGTCDKQRVQNQIDPWVDLILISPCRQEPFLNSA